MIDIARNKNMESKTHERTEDERYFASGQRYGGTN